MRVGASIAIILCLTGLVAAPSLASDDSSALINEALDKPVTMEVNGVLPQVLKTITDQTGVPLECPQSVYDLLPWGEQTSVQASIKNQTLRQALTAITHSLGLNWELGPQSVVIHPRPGLERLGRRATRDELELLDFLGRTPLGTQLPHPTVDSIISAIDQKMVELKSSFAVDYRLGDKVKGDQPVNLPRNALVGDALKELARQTDLTWYPWGRNVVIVSKEDQVGRQLDRTVTMRFNGVDVGEVLAELSKAANVPFSIEAGAVQRVPPDFRKITLILDNAHVREGLENIRGVTGLDYVVKADSIYFWNQNPPATAAAVTVIPSGGPIVATLQLDNGVSLFLREKDIPADILEYAQHKKAEEFARLRKKMQDEKFVPTTRPAE